MLSKQTEILALEKDVTEGNYYTYPIIIHNRVEPKSHHKIEIPFTGTVQREKEMVSLLWILTI